MPEESEHEAPAPLWNGWAMGMLCGLIAVVGVAYGASRAISHGNEWADLASSFQSTCNEQQNLREELAELVERNVARRAWFARLTNHPHPYPAESPMDETPLPAFPPIVEKRYACGEGDEPRAHMRGPSWEQLGAALMTDPQEYRDTPEP